MNRRFASIRKTNIVFLSEFFFFCTSQKIQDDKKLIHSRFEQNLRHVKENIFVYLRVHLRHNFISDKDKGK